MLFLVLYFSCRKWHVWDFAMRSCEWIEWVLLYTTLNRSMLHFYAHFLDCLLVFIQCSSTPPPLTHPLIHTPSHTDPPTHPSYTQRFCKLSHSALLFLSLASLLFKFRLYTCIYLFVETCFIRQHIYCVPVARGSIQEHYTLTWKPAHL